MTAGAVAAPRIIPIMQRDKLTSSKNRLDTSTLVCIQSDTAEAGLFFTLDGSKPGSGGRRYSSPFLLPSGRVCVRAVAATSDGRQSATVTKVFVVREAGPSQQQASPGERLHRDDDTTTSRWPQGSKVTGSQRPLPGPRVAPPAGVSELATCVWCDAQLPVDAGVCSRGHAPILQQLRPRPQAQVLCACCGRGNPADLSTCLTCDTDLHAEDSSHESNVSCSACRRPNRAHARYCDWCGAKRERAACEDPRAASCLDATPTSCHDISASTSQVAKGFPDDALAGPPASAAAERHAQSRQRSADGGRPPLTAVSPGRGYWRQQLDHVCAHLRSFTHNDAPFRTLLGEPRLGRMTSAVLEEDAGQVSLTLGFVRQNVAGEATHKMATAHQGSGSKASGGETVRLARTSADIGPLPLSQARDIQLLQELGPGHGGVGVVQRLLDQGADPDCCAGDGRPAATIAAVNGHHAVLPLLLQRGADVDRTSGPMKNTALHEAAALGPPGLDCARVLLSCNAGTAIRNKDGLTAYDVAAAAGCAAMMSLLDAVEGAGLTPS
ncbi:double zinc ribbon and ankyrin repeat-containing protein 1 isoform X2 [Festucalex cinctus]